MSAQFAFSQQMPIDFSDISDVFSNWGGSTFTTVPSPTNPNDTVGQFGRTGSVSEQGNYMDLDRSVDLNLNDKIRFKFFAYDTNSHTVIVKLENGTNANIEVGVTTISHNMWTELTFDFSTIRGNGEYNRLTIRIDDGSSVAGTFLIDDINDGSLHVDLNEVDVEYTDLVWSDEFNTPGKTAINSAKWFHQTQLPGGGSWFNGEEQHYTSRIENSFVENDNLNIVAIKESFTDQGSTKQYTSARLNSKFAFTYGRVDVRAKLPLGNGTWPAIWTLGKNISESGAYWQTQGFGNTTWPACGEIDILEHGLGTVNHTSSALHTPSSYGSTMNTASQEISDVANNYHIYSVNWSPNQITFLVDGVGYYTYKPTVKNADTWPFDLEQYLILNIAMGGISGSISPSFTQSPMVIDYVRIFQNNVLGVKNNSQLNTPIQVYPNPVNDIIYLDTDVPYTKLTLYDISGKHILTQKKPQESINVSDLIPGVYILEIYSNQEKSHKRVIIN